MKAALEPVKLAVEAMCRQNATLLTAEGIFLFLVREIKKQRTTLAKKLLSAVKNRIQQRRKNDLINLMRYLQNPNTFSQNDTNDIFDDEPLSSTAKESFSKIATTLISSLFVDDKADGQQTQQDANEEVAANCRQVSLFERLQAHIEHSTDFTDTQSDTQSDDRNQLQEVIKQEMNLFEVTRKRPTKLELLFNALLSIPPTSVEAERAFSAAGLFVTKLRSRLSDKSLNALTFLRSYYMKNK